MDADCFYIGLMLLIPIIGFFGGKWYYNRKRP